MAIASSIEKHTQSTPSPSEIHNNTDSAEIENQDNPILEVRKIFHSSIQKYSTLKPWVTYIAIARQWVIIAATIAVAIYSSLWITWILAAIVIAGRQHALMVLGHEAAHHRISSNKSLNNFVGDVFCLLPLFLCLKRWQFEHLQHHRNANTSKDPYWGDFNKYHQWHWPKSRAKAAAVFLKDITGLNTKVNFEAAKRWAVLSKSPIQLNNADYIIFTVFSLLLISGLTLTGGWWVFLCLWVLPLITLTPLFIRIRTIAEHLGIPGKNDSSGIDATRHVNATWLEKMTICPLEINYHIDHHIFPSIPYYNLPAFHKKLLANTIYQQYAHISNSYLGNKGVLNEVIKTRGSL